MKCGSDKGTRECDRPLAVDEIVNAGLCMGCGLCQSIAGGSRIGFAMTPEGRLRPVASESLGEAVTARINAICPGVNVNGLDPERAASSAATDPVWGTIDEIVIAHAGDPDVRYRGSSGGILTALGQYLITSGAVNFVVHVAGSRGAPMRSESRVSFDSVSVIEGASARYGPTAPLQNFESLLSRGEPLAVIGKPCDITAVRNLMGEDERARQLVRFCLTHVCGGISDLTKSQRVLDEAGMTESDLRLFRYRGHGNPGALRAETNDGRIHEVAYNTMWGNGVDAELHPRCKICPDAIGEVADIVASDCWAGGEPSGEDEGFNAVLVRTARGRELFDATVRNGDVIPVRRHVGARELDEFQPHQIERKNAVWARYAGLRAAGFPTPATSRLRIKSLARDQSFSFLLREARGARTRARMGRLGEPPASLERTWDSGR